MKKERHKGQKASVADLRLYFLTNKEPDDYRFGFNTQEKTNEIAGLGNHTTALFWEYDTRLGRRWNLDPVDQISISNYAVNGLNPIANIDPDGDHHYFNNKGQFVSSDNKTDASGNDISYMNVKGKYIPLTKISLETASSRRAVATSLGYIATKHAKIDYSGREGSNKKGRVTLKKDVDKLNSGTLAYTSGKDIIYLDNGKSLGTANTFDIAATFYHEKLHKERGDVESFMEHAQVYLDGMKGEAFKNSSSSYQLGIISSFANHLLNAANQDYNKFTKQTGVNYDNLLNEFNNLKTGYELEQISPATYRKKLNINSSNGNSTPVYYDKLDSPAD